MNPITRRLPRRVLLGATAAVMACGGLLPTTALAADAATETTAELGSGHNGIDVGDVTITRTENGTDDDRVVVRFSVVDEDGVTGSHLCSSTDAFTSRIPPGQCEMHGDAERRSYAFDWADDADLFIQLHVVIGNETIYAGHVEGDPFYGNVGVDNTVECAEGLVPDNGECVAAQTDDAGDEGSGDEGSEPEGSDPEGSDEVDVVDEADEVQAVDEDVTEVADESVEREPTIPAEATPIEEPVDDTAPVEETAPVEDTGATVMDDSVESAAPVAPSQPTEPTEPTDAVQITALPRTGTSTTTLLTVVGFALCFAGLALERLGRRTAIAGR